MMKRCNVMKGNEEGDRMELHIDETIRNDARQIFERLGLTEEEAITLFYKRTVATGRLPFGNGPHKEPQRIKKKRMNERFAEWDAF